MDLHPLGAFAALEETRRHVNSAMPCAPVVEPRERRRHTRADAAAPGVVRRGTAGALRRLADRLDAAGARRPAAGRSGM